MTSINHIKEVTMFETIKSWAGYIGSLLVGATGFVQKCSEIVNLLFVVLGCVGLILSIRLTLKKLRKYDDK